MLTFNCSTSPSFIPLLWLLRTRFSKGPLCCAHLFRGIRRSSPAVHRTLTLLLVMLTHSAGMQQHSLLSGILKCCLKPKFCSLWSGFFFFYKSHHALQVLCTWGKHLKAFGHFCSLTTFMFHPSDIKPWLACWIMTNHPLLDCNHGDEGLILLRVIIHEVLVLLGIQQGRLFNFCAVCRAAAALALLLIISLFLQPTCVETGDVAEKQRYYCEIKE